MIGVEKEYEFIHGLSSKRLSKRQRKNMALQDRYENLKPVVPYPEVFELEDATCEDPMFYNSMKGRGVVPVPGYWKSNAGRMFPKDYEKPKYRVLLNVVNTGIPELRRLLKEEESGLSLRAKIKERLYPKLGKSLVDQQTLHDAFFLNVWKPHITMYGEVFYPRSEYFMKKCTPGVLSVELMETLGIDEGTPPPWLFNMQKYGMPPSYPDAKIPGLNSSIPSGCSYGYEPGGWGKPLFDVSEETLTDHEEIVHNEGNQYTKPVYMEELEDRVERNTSGGFPDTKEDPEVPEPKDKEGGRAKKAKREKLYKGIRF